MNSETLDKIRGHKHTGSFGTAGDVELRRLILDNEVSTGLAELLVSGPRSSWSDRLRWAASLTTSALKMHLLGWLHKSLTSEHLLVSQAVEKADDTAGNELILSGFDHMRQINDYTSLLTAVHCIVQSISDLKAFSIPPP